MKEGTLKPRKGLGWKWISLIVVLVLVVVFFAGAIFTYRGGPGQALSNIGDAVTDLIDKFPGNGSSSSHQVGGGPAPTTYTDWQPGIVPAELQGVVTLECRYKWYQREDLQDAKYRRVSCSAYIWYTNLSDKTIRIAVKVFFTRGGEVIEEQLREFPPLGGIKPGETKTPQVWHNFDITYWGEDWRWEDLSVQIQLESLVYL